jgi:hypothetical protein
LYSVPGYPASVKTEAPQAICRFSVTPDSIILFVSVTDNKVISSGKHRDQVELWFSNLSVDFSDYIAAEWKGKAYLFRNSGEAGDDADVKRMLRDGDYPKEPLNDPASGKPAIMQVPPEALLRRENVFAGITHFICPIGDEPVVLADREKYRLFEMQTGFQFGQPENFIKKTCRLSASGYEMELRMPVECLGFMQMHGSNSIRTVVEVLDTDHEQEKAAHFATAKNLYYARPWYFNQLNLPFLLQAKFDLPMQKMVEKLKLQQPLVYTKNGWKPYGLSAGPILYAKDFVSETGLMQFLFYPVNLVYESNSPAQGERWERLDVQYDDITIFDQNEVYFLLGGQDVSGKLTAYDGIRKSEFVNKVFYEGNNTYIITLYDYEPNDPLGFGEYGLSADEFYSVQRISPEGVENLFNSGERIKATGKITLGEENGIEREDVKKTDYKWVVPGQEFLVKITYSGSKKPETIRFKRGSSGKFEQMN